MVKGLNISQWVIGNVAGFIYFSFQACMVWGTGLVMGFFFRSDGNFHFHCQTGIISHGDVALHFL